MNRAIKYWFSGITLCFFLLVFNKTLSQRVIKTFGTAQVTFPNSLSRLEVEKKARDMALVNALEKAFGRVIIQGNATYIMNLSTGEKTELSTIFNSIANTYVKGEVIEILSEKFTEIIGVKLMEGKKIPVKDIRCDIEIKAKELMEPAVKFSVHTANCTSKKCITTRFNDQDELIVFFKSPVSGYLWIYLDDFQKTQVLLPPSDDMELLSKGFPVIQDKEYILFGNQEFIEVDTKKINLDRYELYSRRPEELNRVYFIFSENQITKPVLTMDSGKGILTELELSAGYTMPLFSESKDFQRWLIKNRSHNKQQIEVKVIDILITKE